MKTIFRYCIVFVLVQAVFYTTFTICCADFNVFKWSGVSRFFFATSFAMTAAISQDASSRLK